MSKKNVIIIGAAGRDFHNFNTYYRKNDAYNVVAFTAAQIPDIEGRNYPAELAGELYPDGIPIHAEEDLAKLIVDLAVDDCVFSYSDVSYQHIMEVGAIVNAAGANFVTLGPRDTQIKSRKKPDIATHYRDFDGKRLEGGRHSASHALRRSNRPESPALRRAV